MTIKEFVENTQKMNPDQFQKYMYGLNDLEIINIYVNATSLDFFMRKHIMMLLQLEMVRRFILQYQND